MPYAARHEGLLLVGDILRVGSVYKRKRDGETMLPITVRVEGEDVPVKHEAQVPLRRLQGEPSEGGRVAIVGTASEYNGSSYFAGYAGAVLDGSAPNSVAETVYQAEASGVLSQ